MKQLMLIDAGAMVARCLSVIDDNLDIRNIGLTYAFLRSYFSIARKYNRPDVVMAWDTGYEHRMNISQLAFDIGIIKKTYKQDRREKKMKEAEYEPWKKPLKEQQVAMLKEFLSHTNIQQVEYGENEADDIVASYCEKYKKDYDEIIVLTSDKDFYQLLDDNVKIYNLGKKEEFTKKNFVTHYGIQPSQWVDVGALMGDTGDTIQGVNGVGEVNALKIIRENGDIQSAMLKFGSITDKDKLKKTERSVFESQNILKVAVELKKMILNLDIPQVERRKTDRYQLEKLMEDYKFYMFNKDMDLLLNDTEYGISGRMLNGASNMNGMKVSRCAVCNTEYMGSEKCPKCSDAEQLTFNFE